MKALVVAESTEAARELAAGARTLAERVVLICFGDAPSAVADEVVNIDVPAEAVLDDAYETVNAVFDEEEPGYVLVEASRRMKSIAGRLASHAGTAAITNVRAFLEEGLESLYYGGVAQRVQRAVTDVTVCTVVPGTFEGLAAFGDNVERSAPWVAPASPLRLLSSKPVERRGADLSKADVVVAVGRGFAEKEDINLARGLCDKLGAGLGCSRPLTEGVDWMPTEAYIGVSGLMISPKVYVACGISGQMQHMVGCNRAGTLFAINKDKDAPVFKQCDYGLVGDVKDVLPALLSVL